MQTTHPQQTAFVGGEVTPKLLGRSDVERFTTAALRMENLVPRPQGPVSRRRGTTIRNSFGIYPSDVLFSFLPRRDQGVVLAFGEGRIGIPSIGADDYAEPATQPSFVSRQGAASLSYIGFERPDGKLWLRQVFDSAPVPLSDGSFNLYQGFNYWDRATRARVSETFIQPFRATCNLPDDDGDDINPLEPIQDDFFADLAPGPATIGGYPTDTDCEIQARDDGAVAYDSVEEYDAATHLLDAGSVVILEATYADEYTEAELVEDVIAAAVPEGVFVSAAPQSALSIAVLPFTASASDYALVWNPAELSPGLPYSIEWTETFTPVAGAPVVTNRRHSFVFDGSSSQSPVFRLPTPSSPGTVTVSAPIWS